MIDMEPGVYFGVPFSEYVQWRGANNSKLKILDDGTPAHVKYAMDHGDDEHSPAQELGLVVHKLLLEPDRAEADIAIRPPEIKVRRGAKWDAFLAANAGKLIVKDEVAEVAVAMISNLAAHPIGGQLFRRDEGKSEVSIVWIDEATKTKCKARIDRLTELNGQIVAVDLKTCDSAARPAMERSVKNFAYHCQAGHSLRGLRTLAPGPERKWLLVCLETRPPYLPAVFELEDGAVEIGEAEIQKWLSIWAECERSGVWPAYDPGIGAIGLPAWAYKVFEAGVS